MGKERDLDLPFTINQFLEVFKNYNIAVWPFQIVLNLLAVTAVIFSLRKISNANKIVSGILGFLWLWIGVVYHLLFFSGINKAAYVFGIFFIIQGVLFIYAGVLRPYLSFSFKWDTYNIFGAIFIVYALIIYPIFGHIIGHAYPAQPTFGLPCPTTIFTFGILLFTDKDIAGYLLIIPVLWSVIGFTAAVNLRVYEDFGLVVAGIVGAFLIIWRDRKRIKTSELNHA